MSATNQGMFMQHKRTRNLTAVATEDQEQHLIDYCGKHKDDLYINGVIDLYVGLPYNPDMP